MRVARLTALTLLAAVAVGGCSSGKTASSSSPTTEATAVAAATTAPPATAARAGSNDPFCVFVRTYNERFGRINPGALSDPQQFRTVMQDAASAIKDAATNAPASIKADVALMSQALQKLVDSFQKANYDLTKIQVSAFTDLQAPDFQAAGQRLDAYTRQNCI